MIDEKKKLQLQAATSSTAEKKIQLPEPKIPIPDWSANQKTKFREETRTLKIKFIKNCMTHYYNS